MTRLHQISFMGVVFLALGVSALLIRARQGGEEEKISRHPHPQAQEEAAPSPRQSLPTPVASKPLPPPPIMPEDEARIYPLYQDFRTAVALGQTAHRDALLPILSRHRRVAIRIAETELAASTSEMSRDIAEKTLAALRNER